MSNTPESYSITPATRQTAAIFRTIGWLSFGLQVAFGAVSGVALLFASSSSPANEKTSNPGTGFGIFLAVCGVLVLCVSAFLAFRLTRIANRLEAPNPNRHPNKANTIKILRIALITSLVGMSLTLLGAEATIGVLLAKALTLPQGVAVYNAERIIRPLDVLVVQANINVIAAHFVGIVASLWLLGRLNQA